MRCGEVHNMSVSVLKRRTYGMPAVEFLQQGVVRAFRESAFFIDKSQHAQFLRKEHTDLSTRSLELHIDHRGLVHNHS